MRLGLDIDGVVADFLSPFLALLETKITVGPILADSITSVDFREHPLLNEEAVNECTAEVMADPSFWSGLDSLLSTQQWARLEAWSRQGQLAFVTHRSGSGSYDIHEITHRWLQHHGIQQPVLHTTAELKSKTVSQLGIEVFVDDNYENCQDVAERTDAVVLMPHRCYNSSFSHPKVRRIMGFDEIFTWQV